MISLYHFILEIHDVLLIRVQTWKGACVTVSFKGASFFLFCVLNSYYSVFFTVCAFSIKITYVWKTVSPTEVQKNVTDFLNCYSNILIYLLVINMTSRGYNMQTVVCRSIAPLLYMKSLSLSPLLAQLPIIIYALEKSMFLLYRMAGK